MSLSCSTVCWASPAAHSVALLTVLTDRHRKRNHHMVKTKKIWSVVSKPWSLLRAIVGLCAVLLNPAFLHTLTYLTVFFIFHVSCLKIFLFFFNSASWNTRLLLASPSSHTHGVLDPSLMAVCLSFATFSHCTASPYPLWLSQRTRRQWLCAAGVWQVTGGTDFTETGCHFCKVLPLSVWRIGEIGGPTSHYLCSHKALTSSAACNCFDNLITSNCCGGKFISGWHIIALSRVSVLKAVIRI